MKADEIIGSLTVILRDVLQKPGLTMTRATTAKDVEGWDSFAHVNIIVEVEQRFGVRYRAEEAQSLASVGDLADSIARKLAAKHTS